MMSSECKSDPAAGFTLLETIIAFVIISISLALAVRTISFSIHNAERTRVETELRDIAKVVLTENERLIELGTDKSGTVDQYYSWELSVNPITIKETRDTGMVVLQVQHEAQPFLTATFITFLEED